MSWLTGWSYRKAKSIDGSSAGDQSDYQLVGLTLHYGSGTDGDTDVYLNSHGQGDFGDIRFTAADGTTELDYYIEQKVDSDYCLVGIKVASIPIAGTEIKIYYGNASVETTADGKAVFEFFDNFDKGSLGDCVQEDVETGETATYSGAAVEMPNGDIWMFFMQGGATYHDWDGDAKIKYKVSEDGGSTWGSTTLFYDTTDRNDFTPLLFREGNTVYCLWTIATSSSDFENDLYMRKTTNSGASWTDAVRIYGDGGNAEKLKRATGIIKHGSNYLICLEYESNPSPETITSKVIRATSVDGTWTVGADVDVAETRGAMEPSIVLLSDETIYMSIRTKAGYRYKAISDDDGATWDTPVITTIESPEAKAVLHQLASGKILFVWNDASSTTKDPRYPLTLALSSDDMASWESIAYIKTESGINQLSNMGPPYQLANGKIIFGYGHYYDATGKSHLDIVIIDETEIANYHLWGIAWSKYTSVYISSPNSARGQTELAEMLFQAINGVDLSEYSNMPTSGVIEVSLKDVGSTLPWLKISTSTSDQADPSTKMILFGFPGSSRGFGRGDWEPTWAGLADCQKLFDGNWRKLRIFYTPTTTDVQIDDDAIVELADVVEVGYPRYFGLIDTSNSVLNDYALDNLLLRKYVSPEPAWAATGAEEQAESTKPWTSSLIFTGTIHISRIYKTRPR